MLFLKRAVALMVAPSPLLCLAFAPLPSFQRNNQRTPSTGISCLGLTLGFLSFDLDDTLFSTAAAVGAANNRQIASMNERFDSADHFSVVSFQETTRYIRGELTEHVSYTSLRKLAIRQQIEESGQLLGGSGVLDCVVDDIFNVWLQERHAAAERHLFEDAIETLESIKQNFPDVCIAAITNGRGNPLDMPNTIAPYFDFCVSGEDDDVFPHRKPAPLIYETALQRYRERFPHHHYHALVDSCRIDKVATASATTASSSDRVWCHVGDCLVNDVGASAACGAFAVWYNPNGQDPSSVTEPSWSTATPQDVERRKRLARVAQTRISTRISKLSELEHALNHLLES